MSHAKIAPRPRARGGEPVIHFQPEIESAGPRIARRLPLREALIPRRQMAHFATGGLRRGGVITNSTLPATKRSVMTRTTTYGIVRSVSYVPSV